MLFFFLIFSSAAFSFFFFFNDTATTEIYTLSLHDALPISGGRLAGHERGPSCARLGRGVLRSEEHTSELQSPGDLVCRLLLEKKKLYDSIGRGHNKRLGNVGPAHTKITA